MGTAHRGTAATSFPIVRLLKGLLVLVGGLSHRTPKGWHETVPTAWPDTLPLDPADRMPADGE